MRQRQYSKTIQYPDTDHGVEAGAEALAGVDPRLYFLMRRLREFAQSRFAGEKIRLLDVGCADGSFMKIVSDNLGEVVRSVDGADVPSRWLRQSAAQVNGRVYLQDFQQGVGGVPEERYHAVTMWEVVEHIENAYSLLRNIRRVMAPGGGVLLSSPNLLSVSRFVKRGRWVGISEQDHKYLFDAQTIRMVLQRAGFVDVSVRAYFLPSRGPAMDWCNRLLSVLPGGGMLFVEAFKGK